ncbi:solute carrier family 23 protein [Peptococcaceae bacterium 1198_IL3148]
MWFAFIIGLVMKMAEIKLKYRLNEVPPLPELMLLGLQWLAVTVPVLIIIGKVVAELHFNEPLEQIVYMQKLFFVVAVSLLLQLIWGHRLPLIVGPATALLVAIIASQASGMGAIYSSVLISGAVLTLVSITGLFSYLKKLFTPRVVATILILIALTLTPTIMNLIINTDMAGTAFLNLCFAVALVLAMFVANHVLMGIWRSTLIVWATIIGSLLYLLLVPHYQLLTMNAEIAFVSTFFSNFNLDLTIEPGVLVSFLVCFLALSINDLGSIQSVGEVIKSDQMPQRVTRGIAFTGLSNVLSGLMGVIGQVNFSLSPGLIAATGNASRFTLIPTGLGLLLISFLPKVIAFMGSIPSAVVGATMIYLMCSQISAGLLVVYNGTKTINFESGLVIGLPLMLSIIVSILPTETLAAFPTLARPIIGNGFVVGVLAVLLMEHIIYRDKTAD